MPRAVNVLISRWRGIEAESLVIGFEHQRNRLPDVPAGFRQSPALGVSARQVWHKGRIPFSAFYKRNFIFVHKFFTPNPYCIKEYPFMPEISL